MQKSSLYNMMSVCASKAYRKYDFVFDLLFYHIRLTCLAMRTKKKKQYIFIYYSLAYTLYKMIEVRAEIIHQRKIWCIHFLDNIRFIRYIGNPYGNV